MPFSLIKIIDSFNDKFDLLSKQELIQVKVESKFYISWKFYDDIANSVKIVKFEYSISFRICSEFPNVFSYLQILWDFRTHSHWKAESSLVQLVAQN